MNERIRLLAECARCWANVKKWDTDSKYGDMRYEDLYNEKFAELIIKECVERAKSVGDLRGTNDDMIYGADAAAVQIIKHFGIKYERTD